MNNYEKMAAIRVFQDTAEKADLPMLRAIVRQAKRDIPEPEAEAFFLRVLRLAVYRRILEEREELEERKKR